MFTSYALGSSLYVVVVIFCVKVAFLLSLNAIVKEGLELFGRKYKLARIRCDICLIEEKLFREPPCVAGMRMLRGIREYTLQLLM